MFLKAYIFQGYQESATTLIMMTLGIMTHSHLDLFATLSIKDLFATLSIKDLFATLTIKDLFATLSINGN